MFKKTMQRYSLTGITLTVYFDTRRLKEELTFPKKYPVIYIRKQVYYTSGTDLTDSQGYSINITKKRELIEVKN